MTKAPRPVKVKGKRGDWTVDMDGTHTAVIHDLWYTPPGAYHDPMEGVDLKGARYTDFIGALKDSDTVVMQKSKDDGTLARLGYIGVFKFKDLDVADDGAVSLTITERLPLKPAA
ncbi:MAG: hypothetical protein KJO42_07910 [Silicimonas sp.]|nr:hypothetical protein [Silicimonas sp.]NNF92951.1 hypothetical protein [Boseongicola sp.]RZW06632.1 MAG: hypothetical protein EX266_07295 [Paracoccaceae bacterium]MBT8425245.1 hypothetical protein [Silicimonas sp.]NND19415.1 hypothetical protein [Silicimonas sp.]